MTASDSRDDSQPFPLRISLARPTRFLTLIPIALRMPTRTCLAYGRDDAETGHRSVAALLPPPSGEALLDYNGKKQGPQAFEIARRPRPTPPHPEKHRHN